MFGFLFVLGTLAELANLPGMPSEPTLRDMIRQDDAFEGIVRRGVGKGDAWEIDLRVAARYVTGIAARKAEQQRQREGDLRQMAMDLGLGGQSAADVGFSIADRTALIEEEVKAIKLGQLRGEVVEKASVEAAVGMLMVMFQQQRADFSARLGRRIDLPRAVQIELDRMLDSDLAVVVRRLRELAKGESDGDGRDAAAAALDDSADGDRDTVVRPAVPPAGAEGEIDGQ